MLYCLINDHMMSFSLSLTSMSPSKSILISLMLAAGVTNLTSIKVDTITEHEEAASSKNVKTSSESFIIPIPIKITDNSNPFNCKKLWDLWFSSVQLVSWRVYYALTSSKRISSLIFIFFLLFWVVNVFKDSFCTNYYALCRSFIVFGQ